MIEPIFETVSPLGEPLTLFKRVWQVGGAQASPSAGTAADARSDAAAATATETLSLVTGLHGDHLTGLYAAMRLAEFLDTVAKDNAEGYRLAGTVQVFPVVHLRALETGAPSWNFDSLNTDVAFPGTLEGELTEKLCNTLLQHTVRSDYGILLAGPRKWWRESPHIRLTSTENKKQKLSASMGLPLALLENGDPINALRITKHWDDCDLNNFAVSTGNTRPLDRAIGDLLFDGLVQYLLAAGLITHAEKRPSKNGTTLYAAAGALNIHCNEAGLFLPETVPGKTVGIGEKLGEIRDVYDGKVKEEIRATESGLVLGLRDHPLVCSGEAVAGVLTKKYSRWSRLLG
ncbi:MAG: succinylglutamate desuccinylase/aspartoacylase family protein [Nitrospina sp.]|nr:succinylglutamate desuccinylase/aspartoacylase family protein [Nitrospina sp.]